MDKSSADKPSNPWSWFVEKVLPGLFLAVSVAVTSASFAIYRNINELSIAMRQHDKDIEYLKSEMKLLVTKTEMNATLARVEQQLQIVLLRSGIDKKIELK